MNRLDIITDLSHRYGSERYVKGGGGNTSAKDQETLWIKPSGTTLAGLTPEGFVALDRAQIDKLYDTETPEDASAREALVKDLMAAAVKNEAGRPSVEAPVHNVFDAIYVVHTHPAVVNGMTCSVQGEQVCKRLFPDALWIDYIDPGYTLSMEVRRCIQAYATQHGQQPSVMVLKNHGIFIAADTPEGIDQHYDRVMETLEKAYAEADVAITVTVEPPSGNDDVETRLRACFGDAAAFVTKGGTFPVAEGPLSPDHLVYARAFPYLGDLDETSVANYIKTHGFPPKVAVVGGQVYGLGTTRKNADLALTFALDAAQVQQLAQAFGGVEWMTDRARSFIENWEVESYREAVASS